jgi:hypothetical protein
MPQHGMLPPDQGPVAYPESPRRQDSGDPEKLKTSKPKTL